MVVLGLDVVFLAASSVLWIGVLCAYFDWKGYDDDAMRQLISCASLSCVFVVMMYCTFCAVTGV